MTKAEDGSQGKADPTCCPIVVPRWSGTVLAPCREGLTQYLYDLGERPVDLRLWLDVTLAPCRTWPSGLFSWRLNLSLLCSLSSPFQCTHRLLSELSSKSMEPPSVVGSRASGKYISEPQARR